MLVKFLGKIRGFADWYNTMLNKRRWLVSSISVAFVCGAGDYFAQIFLEDKKIKDPTYFEGKPWYEPNWNRLRTWITYGIVFYGPVNIYFFYKLNPWYMYKLYPAIWPNFFKGCKLGTIKYTLFSIIS